MVQVGSLTDRRLQHLLAIEARRRGGLVKFARHLDRSMRLWHCVAIKGDVAMRQLAKALSVLGRAHPAPAVQALNAMGDEADRTFQSTTAPVRKHLLTTEHTEMDPALVDASSALARRVSWEARTGGFL